MTTSPTPWEYYLEKMEAGTPGRELTLIYHTVRDANGKNIARFHNEGNARLFAASHDLFIALQALTGPEGHLFHGGSCDECTAECRDARAALAKATGGTP